MTPRNCRSQAGRCAPRRPRPQRAVALSAAFRDRPVSPTLQQGRDAPDRLLLERPAIANVNTNGLGPSSPSRRSRHPVPLPDGTCASPPHVSRTEGRLKWSNPPETNYVDKHTFAKLKMLNIQPSELCNDQEFIRRAYLDVCGILPAPQEVTKFLEARTPTRRAKTNR